MAKRKAKSSGSRQAASPRTLARSMSVREEMRAVMLACDTAVRQLEDDCLLYEAELALEILATTVSERGNIWLCGNGSGFCTAVETAANLSAPTSRFEMPTRAGVLGMNGAISSTAFGRGGCEEALGSELQVCGRSGDALWCFASDCSSKPLLYVVMKARNSLKIPVILFSDYPGTPLTRFSSAKVRIQPTDDQDRSNHCVHWAHAFVANVLCNQLKRLSRKAGL